MSAWSLLRYRATQVFILNPPMVSVLVLCEHIPLARLLFLTLLGRSTSAPLFNSNLTVSVWPFRLAAIRDLNPSYIIWSKVNNKLNCV